jgi:hypothetical protein
MTREIRPVCQLLHFYVKVKLQSSQTLVQIVFVLNYVPNREQHEIQVDKWCPEL